MSIFAERLSATLPTRILSPLHSAFRNSQSAISDFLTHPVFNTLSQRNRNAALSPATRIARSLALPLHDSARFLHDEAKRHRGNVPDFVAGVRASFIRSRPDSSKRPAIAKCASNSKRWLAEITGFAAVSLQPNAGSQGEFAGLLVDSRIPRLARRSASQCLSHSAHQLTEQTLPARSWPACKVVAIATLQDGDIDLADLRAKADAHARDLAALMVTYPSTHGVFETTIREICEIVHASRRPGLHGRREYERASRSLPARRSSVRTSAI